MDSELQRREEIFSYHLVKRPFLQVLKLFFFPPKSKHIPGLKFSLCLFTMNLGLDVFSRSRYKMSTLALIARWENEKSLEAFLSKSSKYFTGPGAWHIRMRPYRSWGTFKGLGDAHLFEELKDPTGPVVGLTVAKLKLSQTRRFTKWGKPVETQVRSQKGKRLAIVSMRPLQYFSTFSVWDTEDDMLNMVNGNKALMNGMNHRNAMQERSTRPFHHEFTTMRFLAFKELGDFEGVSNYLSTQ